MLTVDSNTFISSDFHHMHKNLCAGSTAWRDEFDEIPLEQVRPFKDQIEMSEVLIENINKKVPEDALLIHLGDWAFGGKENIYNFRKQIKCKNIINVRGNHDQHIGEGKVINIDIEESIDFPDGKMLYEIDWCFHSIYDILKFKYNKDVFTCSHFPFLIWENISKGWINLHGHLHNKGDGRFLSYNQMDVGIDGNSMFEPYSIDEVLQTIKESNLTKDVNLKRYEI